MKKKIGIILILLLIIGGGSYFWYFSYSPKTTSEIILVPSDERPFKDLKKEWTSMTIDKYVIRFAQQINDTWSKSNKVWSNTDYNNIQTVVIADEYAYLINQKHGDKIEKFPASQLPKRLQTPKNLPWYFKAASNKYREVPTVAVSISSDIFKKKYDTAEFEAFPQGTLLFTFTTHEEFHHLQNKWSSKKVNQEAVYALSQNKEAREIRMKIIENLRNAILFPDKEQKYIETAKYWHDDYTKRFKDDFDTVKGMDILEGTARYFDMAMNVRSNLDKNPSKDTIQNSYRELVEKDYTIGKERMDGLADTESYELGGYSGILLEKRERDNKWKKTAEGEKTLTEILFENIKPIKHF